MDGGTGLKHQKTASQPDGTVYPRVDGGTRYCAILIAVGLSPRGRGNLTCRSNTDLTGVVYPRVDGGTPVEAFNHDAL